MISQHWPRWVVASFSKWFSDRKQGIDFFVEAEEQKLEDSENYFEFRMNGPIMTEISKDYWRLEAVVNILIVSKQNSSDIHTIHRNVGIAAAMFTKCVSIYKYGDDDTQLGVMILKPYEKEEIRITHIGQVGPEVKAMQSMVQGYYCMLLEV